MLAGSDLPADMYLCDDAPEPGTWITYGTCVPVPLEDVTYSARYDGPDGALENLALFINPDCSDEPIQRMTAVRGPSPEVATVACAAVDPAFDLAGHVSETPLAGSSLPSNTYLCGYADSED